MKSLYGSPIPEGSKTVVIRPVFGRGNTQTLYKGAIEENGVLIDECQVSKCVSENSGFWSYIDALKRAGRDVGTEEKGFFTWKLSIQFLDQSGAPALIDSKTSVVTAEAHEFYRNGHPDAKEQSSLAVMADLLKAVGETQRDQQRVLAESARDVAVQVSAAVMKPLTEIVDRLVLQTKEETTRADEMTKVAFRGIQDARPQPDLFDGMAKILPAFPAVVKTVKDLLN